MARALLGPSRVEELARRVDTLTVSREGVVDAADAERRRIERDLHDGTQQRLVSLAMNLGMARSALADAPDQVRVAVEEAHEEAKRTLTELRGFIRGLHPAVLDDRGLDAALSGIAARAPLPVSVRVTTRSRCSPTIEAVAYFVVSEALTNVARHAEATRAEVLVEPADDGRIRVVVTDNGRGGASPENGTGLRGLAQRVASVDGTLRGDSPAGGPTNIVAELPCER
jgi:signal transduction histidine kinase